MSVIPKPPGTPVIPKPPGMPSVKIPTPPGLETPKQQTASDGDLATGGEVWGAVDPNQINLGTILVTIGHYSRIMGENPATVIKKLSGVVPRKIVGNQSLYLLTEMIMTRDYRDNPTLNTPHAKRIGAPKDFSGDQPPPGATPAELKTFYQAKQAEQAYIKTKNDNDLNSGMLLRADDAERTFIEAFKIVSHYLDSIGDILERDGVITHAEVVGVDASVDNVRRQLVDALLEATKGEVDNL